jgi:hypothetical protein
MDVMHLGWSYKDSAWTGSTADGGRTLTATDVWVKRFP